MAFPSVYEMFVEDLTTVRKKHFWEYFSGSKLQDTVTSTNSYSTSFPNATGWSSRGTQTSITGGVVNTNFGATDDDSAVLRSLGYDITGDFELRIKHRFISYTSSTSGIIALADSTNTIYNPVTAGSNSVMIGINSDSSGAHSFAFYSVENGVFTNHGDPPISTGRTGTVSNATDYWLKMTKVGNLVTINVYSDSSYSSLVTSCYGSVSSSFPSTLNSIQIGMAWTMSGRGANWTDTDLSLTSDVVGGFRWTTNNVTGTGTFEMADDVDGGFKIITSTSSTAKQSITFNDIRQYDPTASEVIMILKRITDDGGINGNFNAGLSNGNTTYPSHSVVVTNYRNDTYYSLSSTASTGVSRSASTTPTDTEWHTHKLINGSSDLKLNIDGVLGVTRTAHRPTINMQPIVYSNSTSLASETRVRYFEAYNT